MRLCDRMIFAAAGLLLVAAAPGPAVAQNAVSYSGPALGIPDNESAGIGATVVVAGLGTVRDVEVRIDALAGCNGSAGNTNAGITHPQVGQLVLTLTSPAGTIVTLFDRRGGARDNFCNTRFDDSEPALSLAQLTDTDGVSVASTYRPETPLAAFNGEDANGNWTLRVSDLAASSTGTVNRFALEIDADPLEEIVVDLLGDPIPNGCTPGSCSLREAIDYANGTPGYQRIRLPASTGMQLSRPGSNEDGNLTGDIDITDSVQIIGAGSGQTVLTQTLGDRLFHLLAGPHTVALRGFRIQGGSGVVEGGAVKSDSLRLQIEDVVFAGNRASERGGAIHHDGGSGFAADAPIIDLRNVRFEDNAATNSTTADAFGGAIYSYSSGFSSRFARIADSTFIANRADNGGGALEFDAVQSVSNNVLRVERSTFTGNQVTVQGNGGAISIEGDDSNGTGVVVLDVLDSIFQQNSTPPTLASNAGGAIASRYNYLRLVARSLFEHNTAATAGAIDDAAGEIIDSTFCDNTAEVSAGALRTSSPLIRRSTFCNNRVLTTVASEFGGGAIAAPSGNLTIERSTFDGNVALRGGTLAFGTGDLTLHSNTLVAAATLPAGALGSVLRHTGTTQAAELRFAHNILIGQCSFVATVVVPDSALYNIEASGNTCRLGSAPLPVGNQTAVSGASINLAPLADNGGFTDTRLPVAPSIATDAAANLSCIARDQRGFLRTDSACDVGAVEAGAVMAPDLLLMDGFE